MNATKDEKTRAHYAEWCRGLGIEPAPVEVYERVVAGKIVDCEAVTPRKDGKG